MTDEAPHLSTIHDLIAQFEAAPADWKDLVFITDAAAGPKESSLGSVKATPTDDLEGRIVRLFGAPLDVWLRLKRQNGTWSKMARLTVDARAALAYAQSEAPPAAPAPAAPSAREAELAKEVAELRAQVSSATAPRDTSLVPASPFAGALQAIDVAKTLATMIIAGPPGGAPAAPVGLSAQETLELGKKLGAKGEDESWVRLAITTLGPGLVEIGKDISSSIKRGVEAQVQQQMQGPQQQQQAAEQTTAQVVDDDPSTKGNAA